MFTTAEHALDWAYNVAARPIVKTSAINTMRQDGRFIIGNALLTNLTVQEAHGQAAEIIGMVERLSAAESRAYLAARFGGRLERSELLVLVYCGCDSLGVGIDKKEAVYKIIKTYFRGSLSVRTIMRELGCRHLAATMAKSCLYDVLDIIHDAAISEITEQLQRHNLIDSACYA